MARRGAPAGPVGLAALVPVLALALDLLLGDPPNRWHPVAWMGTAIDTAQRLAPRRGRALPLAWGAVIVTGGAVAAVGIGQFLEQRIARLPAPIRWLVVACLLKSTAGLRGLSQAAAEVEATLERGDLPGARRLAAWHLVSRGTSTLNGSQVAAATVESVAENTSDGVIGPLVYYAFAGLPGALAYRWVNTCDSMLGYRDAEREWLGKVPARLDDLANLLPARLTALLLLCAAWLSPEDAQNAWRIWRRDAGATESPNAGHPMSAMAGALGVELEKAGHYRLGAGQRPPDRADIRRSTRMARCAAGLGAGLVAATVIVRGQSRRRL
jgi:adenosylcobinamide-phosphate synthase